jgi:hypothetical protein
VPSIEQACYPHLSYVSMIAPSPNDPKIHDGADSSDSEIGVGPLQILKHMRPTRSRGDDSLE